MNPVEIEEDIRRMKLMLGSDCLHRGCVPSDYIRPVDRSDGEPEFVVETFIIGPNGEMRVSRPPNKATQRIPPAQPA